MELAGKKLGILVSCSVEQPGFKHALGCAEAALDLGVDVYFYCIDEAVTGVGNERLQALKSKNLKLYACAYGAQNRGQPMDDRATYAGLTVVNDLISATDRFLSFHGESQS